MKPQHSSLSPFYQSHLQRGPARQRQKLKLKLPLPLLVTAAAALALTPMAASAAEPTYVDQGPNWNNMARADFYTRDQGSQLMKYTWLKALKHPDGTPFLGDQLGRYGYLPNPGNPDELPVGFTKAGQYVGLNCSACHTRQISVAGQEYRIDGGPALVDAQSMFADFDKAFAAVLATDASFETFAKDVLPSPTNNDVAQLKAEVKAWFLRYDTLIQRGLPVQSWGPGRMDAVGMIFNRLTGLDIGPPPSFIIAENIRRADAPVRYPFLWNAARQDMTQWPGFAKNGSDTLGLARNLGEVYGVFANFEPKRKFLSLLGIDYLHNNSANFDGLGRLEGLIKKIGPPKFPWPTDAALVAKGKAIFEADKSCADCHGIKDGETRFFNNKTWRTPIQDVGTDSHEYDTMKWTAKTGVLEGREILGIAPKLKPVDESFSILTMSVVGTIIQQAVPLLVSAVEGLDQAKAANVTESEGVKMFAAPLSKARNKFKLPSELQDLKDAFNKKARPAPPAAAAAAAAAAPAPSPAEGPFPYESRVMQGIWATAPYLHNGSVATLEDLLKPASERSKSFKIGPNYDIEKVGMAVEQTKFGDQTLVIVPDRNSGNSNVGHEFGTQLSPEDKKALLEYLKTL